MTYEQLLKETAAEKKKMKSMEKGQAGWLLKSEKMQIQAAQTLAKDFLDKLTDNIDDLLPDVDHNDKFTNSDAASVFDWYTRHYNHEEIEISELPDEANYFA